MINYSEIQDLYVSLQLKNYSFQNYSLGTDGCGDITFFIKRLVVFSTITLYYLDPTRKLHRKVVLREFRSVDFLGKKVHESYLF